MRFKSKYVNPIVIYLLVYIFGMFLFAAGSAIARYAYAYMNHLFPTAFPMFSPVSEKDGYEAYLKFIDITAVFIAVFLINYLAMRFDNSKFEYMISKTDGQYTVKDGMKLYVKEFYVSDIISALIFPTLLAIMPYFIPSIDETSVPIVNFFIGLLESFFWFGGIMEAHCHILVTVASVITVSLVLRAVCTLGALKKWRAAWLSGSMS